MRASVLRLLGQRDSLPWSRSSGAGPAPRCGRAARGRCTRRRSAPCRRARGSAGRAGTGAARAAPAAARCSRACADRPRSPPSRRTALGQRSSRPAGGQVQFAPAACTARSARRRRSRAASASAWLEQRRHASMSPAFSDRISGVRASSISTLSASSTMAKCRPRSSGRLRAPPPNSRARSCCAGLRAPAGRDAVAQVVEDQLLVGAVGDVAGVGGARSVGRHAGDDGADASGRAKREQRPQLRRRRGWPGSR